MPETAIRIAGLTTGYRNRAVLRDLSWELKPAFIGLLGPNGAGKTTLINCLVGLKSPNHGTISIAGGPEQIGYVPQRGSAPGHMRVQEVIQYAAWLQGLRSPDLASAAAESIRLLGLEDLGHRRFRTLSGGQRQRVIIAAALSHRPSILILDEPTVGLDPSHRLAVRRAIMSLTHLKCVLISTHLIEDVQHMCTEVGVLSDGAIRFSGPVKELLAQNQMTDPSGNDYGSPFERAYENLINRRGPTE